MIPTFQHDLLDLRHESFTLLCNILINECKIMSKSRYLTATAAADKLGVSVSTLYAYVSRGLVRSEAAGDDRRERRYYAEDIERLLARKEGRRNPEKLAKDALYWGSPVLDSAITLIEHGNLYYRGHNVSQLARHASVEEVAALIWTGDKSSASTLFDIDIHHIAQKYETMLLHIGIDGAHMTGLQELQTFLPAAAADDMSAYDFRPAVVAATGARIMRLMASIAAGDVPHNTSIAHMLQLGWAPDKKDAQEILTAALVVCADHDLNSSTFTARVVASAGSTPYAVVISGLAALQGVKHGGYTERAEALINEVSDAKRARDTLAKRLRRGESIPGFGHLLYTSGDPRAAVLLDMLRERYSTHPEMLRIQAIVDAVDNLTGEAPTVDFALVSTAKVLGLADGSALTMFALGRTMGWIGHAIEQYETDRLIRPRARYTGAQPINDTTQQDASN